MIVDLPNQLLSKLNELTQSIRLLREHGEKLAQAEHDYKVELSKEVMRLKADSQPATLINLIIHGQKSVAELRLRRDIAQVIYSANQEHINVTKLQIKILESQIQREWNS